MPVRYDIILADIDNTLFDFDADACQALEQTFLHFGFPWNEVEKQRYFANIAVFLLFALVLFHFCLFPFSSPEFLSQIGVPS